MKLAFFLANLGAGGAERVTCTLANYLSKIGNEVLIITLLNGKSMYKLDEKIQVVSLSNHQARDRSVFSRIKNHIQRTGAYYRCIKNEKPDIVVAMLNIPIYIALLFKKKLKTPVVISERGDPYTLYSHGGLHSFLVRKLYPKADKLIFQTQMASDYFKKIPSEKKTIVANPLSETFSNITPFSGRRKREIVAVGRLDAGKNYSLLLNAYAKLNVEPKPELKIFGEGPLKDELQDLTAALGVSDTVKFMGFSKNVAQDIYAAGCYVLSSNHEGMPNALMEAMALGLPCISTDCPCGGPKTLLENGVSGLLVPVGDIEALANAITKVFTMQDEAEKYSRNAFMKMKDYRPNVICTKWWKILSLAAMPGGRA